MDVTISVLPDKIGEDFFIANLISEFEFFSTVTNKFMKL